MHLICTHIQILIIRTLPCYVHTYGGVGGRDKKTVGMRLKMGVGMVEEMGIATV